MENNNGANGETPEINILKSESVSGTSESLSLGDVLQEVMPSEDATTVLTASSEDATTVLTAGSESATTVLMDSSAGPMGGMGVAPGGFRPVGGPQAPLGRAPQGRRPQGQPMPQGMGPQGQPMPQGMGPQGQPPQGVGPQGQPIPAMGAKPPKKKEKDPNKEGKGGKVFGIVALIIAALGLIAIFLVILFTVILPKNDYKGESDKGYSVSSGTQPGGEEETDDGDDKEDEED